MLDKLPGPADSNPARHEHPGDELAVGSVGSVGYVGRHRALPAATWIATLKAHAAAQHAALPDGDQPR